MPKRGLLVLFLLLSPVLAASSASWRRANREELEGVLLHTSTPATIEVARTCPSPKASGLEAIDVAVTKRIAKCLRLTLDRLPRVQVEALLTEPSRDRSRRLLGHCVGEAPLEQPRSF